ncbi:MarR family winged helix-turn-helix transcriptional regulator [Microbacterium stercoris]|uniref:Winged helix-turn-helix transcriptional regulator n=1 Tax=Microbacterium stercoris TaxID=2820289 RepID=A0A939QHR5_9MICO|nr:MarR family winged helix-turn-helix transcriptional regulator [Microbacterium stercoris]MBO3661902.1 winged helix-turn-helix transcriptional regulator [Microbacterium stercoris]
MESLVDEEPEPLRHLGHLLRRAQQVHLAAWQREVSRDITSVQYAALAVLERLPGSSQAVLGAELDLDRSTIADLVARMTRRDLIARTTDPDDRRRNVLELTATGRQTLEALRPRVHGLEEVLVGSLAHADRAELRRILRAMLAEAQRDGLLASE